MKGELEKNEMRAGLPILAFADPAGFDAWLASQGPIAPGLWLRLAKKGAAERTLTSRRRSTSLFAMAGSTANWTRTTTSSG
jgi:hypothetical protein